MSSQRPAKTAHERTEEYCLRAIEQHPMHTWLRLVCKPIDAPQNAPHTEIFSHLGGIKTDSMIALLYRPFALTNNRYKRARFAVIEVSYHGTKVIPLTFPGA